MNEESESTKRGFEINCPIILATYTSIIIFTLFISFLFLLFLPFFSGQHEVSPIPLYLVMVSRRWILHGSVSHLQGIWFHVLSSLAISLLFDDATLPKRNKR